MAAVRPGRSAGIPARAAVSGPVRLGSLTKQLAWCLRPGEIAVIAHDDLDAATAAALVRARPAAVVNAGSLVTGRLPVQGARLLLQAGIPVLDALEPGTLARLAPGQRVRLEGRRLVDERGRLLGCGVRLDGDEVERRLSRARERLPDLARRFVRNTLDHLARETALLTDPLPIPPLSTPLQGRPAVVVVRGQGAREDLAALRSFIRRARPALIGVDGGADTLLAEGLRPDLLVGDMDSVSDRALAASRELVVHAYPDGNAPGLARVRRAGRFAHVVPSAGTSEDVAMLLAYEAGARPIVAVGAHRSLLDFLERGRAGMASTLLVRMRIGHALVDARGAAELWAWRPGWAAYASVVAAALSCVAALAMVSGPLRFTARLVWVLLQAGLRLGGLP